MTSTWKDRDKVSKIRQQRDPRPPEKGGKRNLLKEYEEEQWEEDLGDLEEDDLDAEA